MRLKKSNYIEITDLDGEFIACNLITGAMVLMNSSEYKQFLEIINNPNNIKLKTTEIYNHMVEFGFIISSKTNEISIAKENYWKDRLDIKSLNLTIVPTLECNLACSYCYQRGVSTEKITKKALDNIFKFIERKIDNLELLSICWFGGEPLICVDKIIYLNEKLVKLCEQTSTQFFSSISTNSYILNEENIKKLKKCSINEIQTTLAGTKDVHDKFRFNKNNCGTFDTIIKNIEEAAKYWKVMICINLSKKNFKDVRLLINQISDIKNPRIYITFNRIESMENNPCDDICLDINEYNKIALELFKYSINIGVSICDTTKFNSSCIYCAADHINSYGINYRGNVYKCTEIMDESTKIGTIDENGNIDYVEFYYEDSIDPYNDEKCRSCKILPYCNGGCFSNRKKKMSFCPSEKEFIHEYLKLFYERLK
jgi:uncharacterized protein